MDWNSYIRQYRKDHPDQQRQYRINGAIRLLEKEGYKVTPPASAPRSNNQEQEEQGE